MTTLFKITIGIISIIFCLGLVISGLLFQDMAYYKEQQLQELYAKRDDLNLQTQKLDTLISDLKSTIDAQNKINEDLSKKIDELAKLQNSSVTITKPAPITQVKTVTVPTTTTTPTTPVTRAS